VSHTNSIQSYCSDGTIDICYGIDGDPANRDGLLSVASSFERFLQHASNRKLVPLLNMLMESFGPADGTFGSTVLLSGQASIDGNSLDMVIECKLNRRLSERQLRLVKAHLISYIIRDTFECFSEMISELIFEGSLRVTDDMVLGGV
jgi:hypothetical protein